MSKRISDFSLPNKKLRQSASHFGFADAGRSQEQERSGWTFGRFQPRARTANRPSQRRDRLLLADDAAMQLFFDAQKLGDFLFADRRHGHAGPARDHVLDIVLGHDAGRGFVQVVLLAQLAEILALLALFVGIEARLFELLIGDGVLHPVHDELDALLDLGDFGRQSGLAQLHARAGFVDQDRWPCPEGSGPE